MNDKLFHRLLDVIEENVVPLTVLGVEAGNRVFGAAVLRRDDLSLVAAETNRAALSPLWHGEIYTIKRFFELQEHPNPSECIFLTTHQPCCMCASALAWSGFNEIYYLYGYKRTRDEFNMPHDLRMNREIFGCDEPNSKNAYFEWRSLYAAVAELSDPEKARKRLAVLSQIYDRLAERAEINESGSIVV